jgi:hypothetical protein
MYGDWLMGTYWNGVPTYPTYKANINTVYPNTPVTFPGTSDDAIWTMQWVTYTGAYNTSGGFTMMGYCADNTFGLTVIPGVQHSELPPWPYVNTSGKISSPYGIRLFSRYSSPTIGSEVQDGQIAFVKVFDKALTYNEITTQYNTYKGRLGITHS